jgi:hypothetical protein
MKKRARKLGLHRETLRRLHSPSLQGVVGGTGTLPTFEVSCFCTQQVTQCGEITCGPCAHMVVDCPGGEPGG